MRGTYEGMWNVVRFNWPKYALGLAVVLLLLTGAWLVPAMRSEFGASCCVVTIMLIVPLVVSYIIYDRSDLYAMPWLGDLGPTHPDVY